MGALFGMLGCQMSYYVMNWDDNARLQMCNLVCIIVMNFMISTGGSSVGDKDAANIDNWAHLGGLVTGMFMGMAYVVSCQTFTSETWVGMEDKLKSYAFY